MLDIVLDENESRQGIPKWFGRLMMAVACFSFLLSLLQMAENKLVDGKVEQSKCLAIIRNVVQMVCVNLVFMVIRLVIFFKYKKEESIFIAKNGIAIYFSALEIYSIWRSQRNRADQAWSSSVSLLSILTHSAIIVGSLYSFTNSDRVLSTKRQPSATTTGNMGETEKDLRGL